MFQRKRFRPRPKNRGYQRHSNGNGQMRLRSDSFSNDHRKNNFRPTQSAEKLLEKYNLLAKEALTSGDKTLSENYFQHADHFMRILSEQEQSKLPKINNGQNLNKIEVAPDSSEEQKENNKIIKT